MAATTRSITALQGSLKNTLRLPKTSFPSRRPPSAIPDLLKRTTVDLYQRQSALANRETFTLHDGPPYANGDLHMGHALNKILKDFINRTELLRGRKIHYVPGWDCHGLPIEMKALQSAGKRAAELTPVQIRQLAKGLATKTIEDQKAGFKEWGVMGEWENPYMTLQKDYEIRQLGVFRDMVKRGLVYRRFKPVYWSPSTGTALAEAELEYAENHISKAAFIKFPIVGEVAGECGVSALIWTTTPWTIPANKAIAVGKEMEYLVVECQKHGKILLGKERLEYLNKTGAMSEDLKILREGLLGEELTNLKYNHPLLKSSPPQRILTADFVTADSGTGLVHIAPGHGMDDYLLCQSHSIPPFSPVDNLGCYTVEVEEIPGLVGLDAPTEGTVAVLELLQNNNSLVHVNHKYKHKYPYDWRSKKPIMIRATAQWFADVSQIKEPAVSALESVKFTPEIARHRLSAFVKIRNEWCISRQRTWGVPIPALYNKETDEALLTDESVSHIIHQIEKLGTDAWFDPSVPDSTFIPPSLQHEADQWTRNNDTMDVWFDSGTSWTLLPSAQRPADIYLEGSDQARGWFQSSLLTSLATTKTVPFKHVLTHGFVLDKKGKKMSKSLGNVTAPSTFPSPETLRLWVAAADYTKDIALTPQAVQAATETLRKARNTIRFLLGCLENFPPSSSSAPNYLSSLNPIDTLALHQLHSFATTVRQSYDSYQFSKVIKEINTYTATQLSAFYLDVIKDRIYSLSPDDPSRLCAQHVCQQILTHYLAVLQPLVPMIVEEAREHLGVPIETEDLSFPAIPAEWEQESIAQDFEVLTEVHNSVKSMFEAAKKRGIVKVSLELEVEVSIPPAIAAAKSSVLERWSEKDLEELWIVSSVSKKELMKEGDDGVFVKEDGTVGWGEGAKMESSEEVELDGWWTREMVKGIVVKVRRARGKKCPRCWQYKAAVEGAVCGKCEGVLKGMGWTVEGGNLAEPVM